jgi:hypothetical protein
MVAIMTVLPKDVLARIIATGGREDKQPVVGLPRQHLAKPLAVMLIQQPAWSAPAYR